MGNSSSGGSVQEHLDHARRSGVCSLQNMSLKALPPSLLQLSNIRSLDISGNQISELRGDIASLPALKSLTATGNRLERLPEELGTLVKLETLSLASNRIMSVPVSLSNLAHLKTLVLSGNQLTGFPVSVLGCKQLQVLDLADNRITALPDDMQQLQAVELILNRNQVAALPESLAQCRRLKVLRLEENCLQLDGIPAAILAVSNVSTLALEGNPFNLKELEYRPGYNKYAERVTATLAAQWQIITRFVRSVAMVSMAKVLLAATVMEDFMEDLLH